MSQLRLPRTSPFASIPHRRVSAACTSFADVPPFCLVFRPGCGRRCLPRARFARARLAEDRPAIQTHVSSELPVSFGQRMPRFAVWIVIPFLTFGCEKGTPSADLTQSASDVTPDSAGLDQKPVSVSTGAEASLISVDFHAGFDPRFSRGTLAIGSAAPPVTDLKWMRGQPVETFAGDQVYVVEFWATWCGPCLQSLLHLADLQKVYGSQVRVIGVTDEDQEAVEVFLKQKARGVENTWSEVLNYSIALDKNVRPAATGWTIPVNRGFPVPLLLANRESLNGSVIRWPSTARCRPSSRAHGI
jgi:thiol-disulfide isomerase/thioredoxin